MVTDDKKNPATEQEAWQVQVARFALLSEVVLLIARTPDLNRLLAQAINKLKWVIDFERCTLALLNDNSQSYRLQTLLETRRNVSKVTAETVPLDHDLPGEVMRRRQMRLITDLPAAINNFSPVADPALADGSLASILSLPLQAYGKVLGAITFSTVRSGGYSDGDIKVATSFATHLALAIDRWQQTQQLQQANQELARLASFPELNPGPIVEIDLNCNVHYLNPAARQLFPDIETRGVEHPLLADFANLVAVIQSANRDSFTDEVEVGEIWYQRVWHCVQKNQRVRIYASDITERKQAEEAIRQQNEYLAALHHTSLGLISRLDLNELFSALITRAAQLLDASHGYIYLVESDSENADEAFIQPKVGLGVFGQDFSLRLQSGEGLAGKVWQTGQPLVVDDYDTWPERSPNFDRNLIRAIMGVPLKSGAEVVGVIGIAYSRESERKFGEEEVELLSRFAQLASIALDNARLFEKTQQANHELSQALENLRTTQSQLVEAEKMAALGGLVAGVAHEINTPVGVGVTAASLLEDKTRAFREIYSGGQMKRSDLEKYLDTAEQSSQMLLRNLQRAAELIQSFKQVAVDQSSEERREFRVKQYLDEILLSLRPQLKKTQHVITINGDSELALDSYPGAFSQIVTNLVMNSLVHAFEPDEAGQLTFNFEQVKSRLVFEYTDNGRGIPPENLNKIFDPFFTTKRGQGGSGLGLHIIYNLVTQKLGGTIRCESEVGVGTRFIMEIPAT
jgi:signal transduction histidine kinase